MTYLPCRIFGHKPNPKEIFAKSELIQVDNLGFQHYRLDIECFRCGEEYSLVEYFVKPVSKNDPKEIIASEINHFRMQAETERERGNKQTAFFFTLFYVRLQKLLSKL